MINRHMIFSTVKETIASVFLLQMGNKAGLSQSAHIHTHKKKRKKEREKNLSIEPCQPSMWGWDGEGERRGSGENEEGGEDRKESYREEGWKKSMADTLCWLFRSRAQKPLN